jgi:Domain of unknown function (DUF4399)
MRPIHLVLSLAAWLAIGAPPAWAAELLHPWLVPAPRNVKEAYFSNLQDGASIETPFVLRFGLTGIGLAPIVKPVARAGHHHLLVNRELPMDFNKPLPFDDRYIHFGKGQMETVLNFAPGKYQLRLVMADDKHIPNFVYSKPISVTVTRKNEGVDPKSLVKTGVMLLSPKPGQVVKPPFRLQFHASGFNVSSSELTEKGSGHFRVRLKSDTGREELITMSNGYTEAWLDPPAGNYSARLEFMDNAAPGQVLAVSEPVTFKVER